MKNLLIYINPRRDFDEETSIMAKIQIDNSLDLGWKKEDIIFVTNFPYEYSGIKALVVGDGNFCIYCAQASKINTILNLFDLGYIKGKELYWFHDFDVFQVEKIEENEMKLELGKSDFGLTDYGRLPRWNTGSIFFNYSSKDIFEMIKEVVYTVRTDEERALQRLTHDNFNNINERITKLNITYNFANRNTRSCYQIATKPIRAVHFHPIIRPGFIDVFMHSNNKLGFPLMSERLIKIFNKYGFE